MDARWDDDVAARATGIEVFPYFADRVGYFPAICREQEEALLAAAACLLRDGFRKGPVLSFQFGEEGSYHPGGRCRARISRWFSGRNADHGIRPGGPPPFYLFAVGVSRLCARWLCEATCFEALGAFPLRFCHVFCPLEKGTRRLTLLPTRKHRPPFGNFQRSFKEIY